MRLAEEATERASLKSSVVGEMSDCMFIVTEPLGETLYELTHHRLRSAFSPSTALRVAMQASGPPSVAWRGHAGTTVARRTHRRRACSRRAHGALQTLKAIETLHKLNYLHRYLTPWAFATGTGPQLRSVVMMEFGFRELRCCTVVLSRLCKLPSAHRFQVIKQTQQRLQYARSSSAAVKWCK